MLRIGALDHMYILGRVGRHATVISAGCPCSNIQVRYLGGTCARRPRATHQRNPSRACRRGTPRPWATPGPKVVRRSSIYQHRVLYVRWNEKIKTRTLYLCARAPCSSVSTVTRSIGRPEPVLTSASFASFSRIGESTLQGPHQLRDRVFVESVSP
jgi:hypothetical protein